MQNIKHAHHSRMASLPALLHKLEEEQSRLRSAKLALFDDMDRFCRASADPVAQDIRHRLEVIDAADTLTADMKAFCRASGDPVAQDIAARLAAAERDQDTFEADLGRLERMYDQSREARSDV